VALPQGEDPLRIGSTDFAYKTQIRASLFARTKGRPIASAHSHRRLPQPRKGSNKLFIDAPGQDHDGNVASFGIRDAQTIHELRRLTELLERLAERLAAAVNQSDLMAIFRQQRSCACNPLDHAWLFEHRASDFEYELQFNNPVVSGQPYITFMFCSACPAAPFIKLSIHEI